MLTNEGLPAITVRYRPLGLLALLRELDEWFYAISLLLLTTSLPLRARQERERESERSRELRSVWVSRTFILSQSLRFHRYTYICGFV